MEKNGGVCKINISIEKNEDDLFISVSDNGGGISENIISSIKNGDYESGFGIGLKNVEKRIRLIDGEDYGVEIRNRDNGGTAVTMRIPAKPVENIKEQIEKGEDYV